MKLATGLILFGFTFWTCNANAVQNDLTQTATQAPAFRVTCGTSVTRITAAAAPNWTELRCGTVGATPVFIGDINVNTSSVTSSGGKGWPICTDSASCLGNIIEIASNNVFCKVASGTVVIACQVVRY